MVHALTQGLTGILHRVSTLLLVQRKFDKHVMITEYFYKFLCMNIAKTWGATDKPKFNKPKNPWSYETYQDPTVHELSLKGRA